MTELDRAWARTQVEKMADGSLSADAERRMLAVMQQDAALRASVERARRIHRELRRLDTGPVPAGLWWRLWRIPGQQRPAASKYRGWVPAGAIAAAAAAVIAVGLFQQTAEPPPDDAERMAAVQDFAVAVAYLQKSAVMARNEVNEAVGSGVINALATSRGMIEQTEIGSSEGEQENVD